MSIICDVLMRSGKLGQVDLLLTQVLSLIEISYILEFRFLFFLNKTCVSTLLVVDHLAVVRGQLVMMLLLLTLFDNIL